MAEEMGITLNEQINIVQNNSNVMERSSIFDSITVSYFENEIPSLLEAEMERLYGNIYSSAALFRFNNSIHGASTFTAWKDGNIIAILIYKYENGIVKVLNELIRIPPECIRRFADYIFSSVNPISYISFNAIQTNYLSLSFPYQRINCSENIVISLPDSSKKYFDSLGKNLRKHLRYYSNRIRREFPSFQYHVFDGADIDERYIQKIVGFNAARMVGKNKVSGIKLDEAAKILSMVKLFKGFISLVMIEGQICAGEICCREGENYFILLGSHDPAFDSYHLGTLSQYYSICECINRGGRECHFLWGREEYKYRFLGERRDLDRIIIYRSFIQFLLNIKVVVKYSLSGRVRQAKMWLTSPERKDKPAVRFVTNSLKKLRSLMITKRNLTSS